MSVPNSFTANTRILSDEVNTNFNSITEGNAITNLQNNVDINNTQYLGYFQSDDATTGYKTIMDANGNIVIYDDVEPREIIVPVSGSISAAVSTIEAGGVARGIVRLLPGIHTITSTLAITGGSISIIGSGVRSTTILDGGVSNRMINVVANYVTISDMQIDCNGNAVVGVRSTGDGDWLRLENLRIENYSTSYGIELGATATTRSATVMNCETLGAAAASGTGIQVDRAERCRVIGNYEASNTSASINLTANSTRCVVIGNVVDQAVANAGANNTVADNQTF